jgi:hypothetical protein
MMDERNTLAFEDIKVHVRFKLFALWSSVMFFYIYGDYFELYQPGKITGNYRWNDAFRCYLPASLAGDGCGHDNSQPDAVSVTGPACRSESLDEHRVRRGLQCDYDAGDQGWMALLRAFRSDRNHPDSTYHLVRVDLAEAANPLIASTTHRASGQFRKVTTAEVHRAVQK